MVQTSFNNTAADQNPPPQHYAANNNFSLDQISGFIGGNLGEHSGGFMQFTWSDVTNTSHVDNVDLRPYTHNRRSRRQGTAHRHHAEQYADRAGSLQYNVRLGFPLYRPLLAPAPAGNPILAGAFAGNTIGYTAYAWYDSKLYLEGGAYDTWSPWTLARFGNPYSVGSTRARTLSARRV